MKQWATYTKKTKEKCKQIIDAGFTLIEMWECQWLKTKEYKETCNNIVEPLNPRDAFYGGRTNARKLKDENKILRYIDVCSLYLTVQYFYSYPVGHPEKIYKPEKYDENWYGLIKCKILAPKNYTILCCLLKKKSYSSRCVQKVLMQNVIAAHTMMKKERY